MSRKVKTDRTARLLNVEHLLYQNPAGLTVGRIAELCGISRRTTYRDLNSLQCEVGIGIWEEGSLWGVVEGQYLPPIRFRLQEALRIFFAARLMLSYASKYDPNIASAFTKLNSVVRPPLRDQIQKTMEWMQKMPWNEEYLRTISVLAEAWVSQLQVKISYRSLEKDRPTKRIIEPYFIEPVVPGHASYVIAYCRKAKSIRTFKVERIETIDITSQSYEIPLDFDINTYLGSSWGITVYGEVKLVRLRIIAPDLARIMGETIWHPSQVLEARGDGSMVMTLRVTDSAELCSWILSWGDKIEVLEPRKIRARVIAAANATARLYQ